MADGSAPPFQSTRDRHAIGDYREHLVGEKQQGSAKPPRLSVYYHKSKMVVEIRTNVDNDMNSKDRGIIRAELEGPAFFTFLAMFERILDNPELTTPERLQILRPDFQKKNNGEPVLDVTLVFGRSKDGAIFMSGLSWDKARPAVQFVFHPGRFMALIGPDGAVKSIADASLDIARGYLKKWQLLAPMYMYNRYVAESFDKPTGGQGGGGGYNNNRGGGGGGYNNNNSGGGGQKSEDMRSETRQADTNKPNWDDLPF